ncbi:hypothetical protein FQZ97_1091930 [compost metagenome]
MLEPQGLLCRLLQPIDLGDGQLIRQHLGVAHPEAPATFDANPQQAVGPLLEVADPRLAANRREAPGGLADLAPFEEAHHTEAFALLHAAADHVQVARLEYLQIERTLRKQHGVERKQRQLHGVVLKPGR